MACLALSIWETPAGPDAVASRAVFKILCGYPVASQLRCPMRAALAVACHWGVFRPLLAQRQQCSGAQSGNGLRLCVGPTKNMGRMPLLLFLLVLGHQGDCPFGLQPANCIHDGVHRTFAIGAFDRAAFLHLFAQIFGHASRHVAQ